jgi:hypothetical protein
MANCAFVCRLDFAPRWKWFPFRRDAPERIIATTWMGFTPRPPGDTESRNKCASSVLRQYGKGYIIEYITVSIEKPNAGFENDPLYLKEREEQR